MDGEEVVSLGEMFDPTLQNVDSNEYLNFFWDNDGSANMNLFTPFSGTIYNADLYQVGLSDSDVSNIYQEGLGRFPVIPLDMTEQLQEDEALHKIVFNVMGPNTDLSRPVVWIDELPHRGSLFQEDMTQIIEIPYSIGTDSFVFYTPPKDENARSDKVFTKVVYSIEGRTAQVDIYVEPVNDPPVAISENITITPSELSPSLIELKGVDPDYRYQPNLAATIYSVPDSGILYDMIGSEEIGDEININQEGGNFALFKPTIAYEYQGGYFPAADGIVGKDEIQFMMTDMTGLQSLPATLTINVKTPLDALPATRLAEITFEEGNEQMVLSMKGRDQSHKDWLVGFQILSLPSNGQVFSASPDASDELEIGSILPPTVDAAGSNKPWEFPFKYVSNDPHYFNSPPTMYNGTSLDIPPEKLSYQIVALDLVSHEVIGKSVPVLQNIRVLNVNNAPTLTGPSNVSGV
eukprot:scaffold96263_cov66-Attheya_sp.AAC.1